MGVPQQAAQRYYNKGTGRMEALVHGKFPGAPSHVPGAPGAHNVSKTTSTTTRTTPVFNSSTVADWTRLNGPQLRQFAEYLVGQDTKGAQAPFQQANQRLGGEQQRTQQAIGQAGQGVLSSIQGTQAKQAQAAQGFASQGAQIAAQGKQGVEQAYKGYEGGALTPEVQAQRAADLARQAAQSQAAQTGANARQQELSAWLANSAATAPQRTQQQEGQVASQYGKLKAGNSEKEAALIAQQPGNVQKLWLQLVGQQQSLKKAEQALGIQVQKNEITSQNNRQKNTIGAVNAQTNQRRAATGEANAQSLKQSREDVNAYRNASLAEKKRLDSANIGDKEKKLMALGKKLKLAEGKTGSGGVKVSAAQKAAYERELGVALNAFERGSRVKNPKTGREEGRDYQGIRNELGQGNVVEKIGGKSKLVKIPTAHNAVILDAAEQLYRYHYVNSATKAKLKEFGLPYEGLSNLLMRH